jgi:hypothetical protein
VQSAGNVELVDLAAMLAAIFPQQAIWNQ